MRAPIGFRLYSLSRGDIQLKIPARAFSCRFRKPLPLIRIHCLHCLCILYDKGIRKENSEGAQRGPPPSLTPSVVSYTIVQIMSLIEQTITSLRQ